MISNRRSFIQGAGSALAALSLPASLYPVRASAGHILVPSAGSWNDPDVFALAEKGVDIAMSMGAEYADVRLTNIRQERIVEIDRIQEDDEWGGVGIRVIKDGHWGFMSSAVWSKAEIERLAKGAVGQADAFAKFSKGQLSLALPPTGVKRGEWVMPVEYDPFTVTKGEKMDFLFTLQDQILNYDRRALNNGLYRAEKKIAFFASSNNSQWKQTTFRNELEWRITYPRQASLHSGMTWGYNVRLRTPAGRGWEYIIDPEIFTEMIEEVEEAKAMRFTTPVEIDRYDAVFKPRAVAAVLGATIGGATELDRALGYEANSVGTSFLDNPVEMLGTYQIGNSKLTVSADRTMEGGLNTVKWDDEGVPAQKTVIVDKGIVSNFQTTRETASHLETHFQKNGKPVISNGSTTSQSALFFPTQHTSNLYMEAGEEDLSFNDLVSKLDRGFALMDVSYVDIDFQCLNATVTGSAREIRKGKLERYISDAAIMIRTPELWKSMAAIGGPSSRKAYGFKCAKGQPEQAMGYSVSAVPAIFQNMGLINETAR